VGGGRTVTAMPDPDGDGELAGKVAIVTGAARGIGRATALAMAAQGAAVVAADRKSAVQGVAAAILKAGGRARSVVVDVTDSAAMRSLVDLAVSELGGLDVLFNNAGITGRPCPLAEQDEEAFDHVLEVNVKGVFLGMRYALPVMMAQGSGSIVNTASVTAVKAIAGMGAYSASKHAIVGLTRVAAVEAGPSGVRVNALMPGPTATPMIGDETFDGQVPMGRVADPAEQAAVACFLAGPRSSFVNGETILVDGGMAYAG
jgi:NAD(P)-dependent dehydrogenase (short-subunit alcohol dehydrogenase family)